MATTVDDLVYKLREARTERAEKKKLGFKRRRGDEVDDEGRLRCNSVSESMEYVNHYFMLGIKRLPMKHRNEDTAAQILHDVVKLPMPMVVSRLKREGAMFVPI